jgi:hypothetical protein
MLIQHTATAMADPPVWTAELQAIGAILVPIVVAALAFVITRNQSRSEELLRTRLEYYKALAPDLNRLMCYMTFIGGWRDDSPADIVRLKRSLDTNFNCAAPLFSPDVLRAYDELMKLSFVTFAEWGVDARIKSNAYRRRQAWRGTGAKAWDSEWDAYFALADAATISAEELKNYRQTYDQLIAATVRDLSLTRARAQYTTNLVSLNAHAPKSSDVAGSQG